MTIIVLMIHYNGSHDNHGMLPHWARIVFLHFFAKILSMSKYITSDDVHELKLHPSFLSLADEDHGSVQNIVKNNSAVPSNKFSPSSHWGAKVKQSHHKYPDLDFHKAHQSHKSLSIKLSENSIPPWNDIKLHEMKLLCRPVEEETECDDSEIEESKTKAEKVAYAETDTLSHMPQASTNINRKTDNVSNNANACVCPKQCEALCSSYKDAVEKKLCLCELNKQLVAHAASCHTAANTNTNQNANCDDTLDVNMIQYLDQFMEKWEILEKTGKLPELEDEEIKRRVEKNAAYQVKHAGSENGEKKLSSHEDIDGNKLLFNMCKRLNEYKNRMVNHDIEKEVKCEWQQVAMVLDRLMFFIFTTFVIVVIIYMYFMIPAHKKYYGLEVDEDGHPIVVHHMH